MSVDSLLAKIHLRGRLVPKQRAVMAGAILVIILLILACWSLAELTQTAISLTSATHGGSRPEIVVRTSNESSLIDKGHMAETRVEISVPGWLGGSSFAKGLLQPLGSISSVRLAYPDRRSVKALSKCAALKELVINHAEADACVDLPELIHGLEVLHLSDVRLTEENFAKILEQSPRIEVLYSDGANLSGRGLSAISSLTRLRELSLRDPQSSDSLAFRTLFGEAVSSMKQLEIVTVSGALFDATCLKEIVQLPRLRELGLAHTRLEAEDLLLCDRCPKLERLYFAGSSLNDDIVRKLTRLPSIRELLIPKDGISPDLLNELAQEERRLTVTWHRIQPLTR